MRLLAPKELAKEGRIGLSTVYTLIRLGKLPAYRIGVNGKGKLLIKWEDWEVFLATCRVSEWPQEDYELKHIK